MVQEVIINEALSKTTTLTCSSPSRALITSWNSRTISAPSR